LFEPERAAIGLILSMTAMKNYVQQLFTEINGQNPHLRVGAAPSHILYIHDA
jgi:hypothetical protein